MAARTMELETLMVRLRVDATQYNRAMIGVDRQFQTTLALMNRVVKRAMTIGQALHTMASGISHLATTIQRVATATAGVGSGTGLTGAGAGITGFINAFNSVDPANLAKIVAITDAMRKFAMIANTKAFGNLAGLSTSIGTLPGLGKSIAGFITPFDKIDPANFAKILTTTDALRKFFQMMSLKSVQNFISNASLFNNLPALGSSIAQFSANLGSVNIGNLNAVANALNAATGAMKAAGAARGGAGGGIPPIMGGGRGIIPSGLVHGGGFAIGVPDRFAFEIQMLRFGIAGLGLASVIAFARFDDAITRSLSVVENASPQMRRELESIIEGLTTSGRSITSPTELANSFGSLAQAGLSAAQSMEALEVVDRFVLVGMIETNRATEILVSTMHNYGMSVRDLGRISDVIIAASNATLGTAEDVGTALSRVSGIAAQMNISLEESAAALTLLGRAGLVGSEAGTTLMRGLTTIHNAAITGNATWQRYGISVQDAITRDFLPLDQILKNISDRMQGMTGMQKEALLIELGIAESGGTNVNRFLAAMITNWRQLGDITKEYQGALGTTLDKANQILQSFGNQMKVLWNNVKSGFVSLGSILVPSLLVIRQAIMLVVQAIVAIPAPVKSFVGILMAVVTSSIAARYAFGSLFLLLFRLGPLATALTASFAGLRAVMLMAGLTGPIGWIIMAVAAMASLVATTDEGKAALVSIGQSLMTILTAALPLIASLAQLMPPIANALTMILVPAFQALALILRVVATLMEFSFSNATLVGIIAIASLALAVWGLVAALKFSAALLTVHNLQLLAGFYVQVTRAIAATWAWVVALMTLGASLNVNGIQMLAAFHMRLVAVTAATWAWVSALAAVAIKFTLIALAIAAILEVFSLLTGQGSIIDRVMNAAGGGAAGLEPLGARHPSQVPTGAITGYRSPEGTMPVWMHNLGSWLTDNVGVPLGLSTGAVGHEPIHEISDQWINQMTQYHRTITQQTQAAQAALANPFRGEFQQVRISDMFVTEPGGLAFTGGEAGTLVSDTRTHELLAEIRDGSHVTGH